MSNQEEVQQASAAFYAALNRMLNGDAAALAEIWSHSATVTTLHPIGGRQVGWEQVWDSWQQVARICSAGRVKLAEPMLQVGGDLAYELRVEQGEFKLAGEQVRVENRVTNIYRRDPGGWKIVHHHTDVSPAMQAILSRLQAKA